MCLFKAMLNMEAHAQESNAQMKFSTVSSYLCFDCIDYNRNYQFLH